MLDSLDTLIGFVVIMTLLSVLITVCTQMISSLLAMRGKNLANALAITLRTIDPDIGHQAEEVVAHLLSRPGISDSIFSPTRPAIVTASAKSDLAAANLLAASELQAQATQAGVDQARARLAALEQLLLKAGAAVAVADAAGLPAAQRLREQCRQDFRLGAQALATARAAARHPALTAAAARVAVTPSTDLTADGGSRYWKILQPGGYDLTDAVRSDEIYRLLHQMAARTPADAVSHGLSAFTPWRVARLLERVKIPVATDVEAAGKVAATVRLLGANGLLQDGHDLLSGLGRFEKAVEVATAQGYDRFEAWFNSTEDRARQWFATHTRLATVVCAALLAFGLQLDLKDVYQNIATDASLRTALVKSAPEVVKNAGAILATPAPANPAAGNVNADAAALEKANADYRTLADTTKGHAYDLIPNGPRWPGEGYWPHFFGMAMMAALLSIGAPFWFNLLAGLSNLRPSIAQVVQDRPYQNSKPPTDSTK